MLNDAAFIAREKAKLWRNTKNSILVARKMGESKSKFNETDG